MNKIKIILLSFGLSVQFVQAQTTLSPGDIAFIAYATDGTDHFAFLLLKDVTTSTQIHFTDNSWLNGNSLCTNEQTCTWTVPNGGLSKGTIVEITDDTTANANATFGTCSGSLGSLAAASDQILAYQSGPAFIAGISSRNWSDTCAPVCSGNTGLTCLPSSLTDGTTALSASDTVTDFDNGYYNGTLSGTRQQLLAAINNRNNWIFSNNIQTWPSWNFSLPVKLIAFTATQMGDRILLSWSTASETNNAYFSLERLGSGNEFQEITQIEGAGSTGLVHSYSYLDKYPDEAKNYYRLRQVDFDGKSTLSEVISISIPTKQLTVQWLNDNHDQIQIGLETTTKVRVLFSDLTGKIILSFDEQLHKGSNTISVPDLPAGIYLLQVTSGSENYHQKIIKRF